MTTATSTTVRDYKVARTEIVFSVWNVEVREALPMRLGLIPSLAMAPKIGARIINARAKTVAEKPAFRNGLRRRRCVILADGYYEWQKTPVGKRPFQIVLSSGKPFAITGLWEALEDPEGNAVPSCTIITIADIDFLTPIRNSMPVILSPEAEELWLDTNLDDADSLTGILVPYPDEAMNACKVSTMVNYAGNDGPEAIARAR